MNIMNNMTNCTVCGKKIEKGELKCVYCGKEQTNLDMKHKVITSLLVAIVLFGSFGMAVVTRR